MNTQSSNNNGKFCQWYNSIVRNLSSELYLPKEDITFSPINNFNMDIANSKIHNFTNDKTIGNLKLEAI